MRRTGRGCRDRKRRGSSDGRRAPLRTRRPLSTESVRHGFVFVTSFGSVSWSIGRVKALVDAVFVIRRPPVKLQMESQQCRRAAVGLNRLSLCTATRKESAKIMANKLSSNREQTRWLDSV